MYQISVWELRGLSLYKGGGGIEWSRSIKNGKKFLGLFPWSLRGYGH